MTRKTKETFVAGEPIEPLIGVLLRFEVDDEDEDGMVHVHAEYPDDIGDPFTRALMRVEAELLAADADVYGTDSYEERTPDQRRYDAFMLLTHRIVDAAVGAA